MLPLPLVVVLVTLAALYFTSTASALDFSVDDTADAVDASPGDGACATAGNVCTLRAALMEANALPGTDAIELPPGVYALTIPDAGPNRFEAEDEDAAASGDLDVLGSTVILGGGSTTIERNECCGPLFEVAAGAELLLEDVSLLGGESIAFGSCGGLLNRGRTELSGVKIAEASGGEPFGGGAGLCNLGVAALEDVEFVDNFGDNGGAIRNDGTLHVSAGVFARNGADEDGGAIFNTGSATVVDCEFVDNFTVVGGAIENLGDLVVQRSSFRENSGAFGATIYSDDGSSLDVEESVFFANCVDFGTATLDVDTARIRGSSFVGNGPCDVFAEEPFAGAILARSLRLLNTTVSGNASLDGAVIARQASIESSTISDNVSVFGTGGILGPATLRNSVIAGNSSGRGFPDCMGDLQSLGHNLIGDATGCTIAARASDLIGSAESPADPMLAPLIQGDELRFAHRPLPGSPLLDVIPLEDCAFDDEGALVALTVDQLGLSRPQGERCDIGAVEVEVHDQGIPGDLDGDGDVDRFDARIRASRDATTSVDLVVKMTASSPHTGISRLGGLAELARTRLAMGEERRIRYYPYANQYKPAFVFARFVLNYHAGFVRRAPAPTQARNDLVSHIEAAIRDVDHLASFD